MEEIVLPAKRADGLCNARVKGEYCTEPSGVGTKTPGVGRCYRHAGSRNRRALRWDDVEDDSVRAALDKFAADEDALDTVDDILLLRALIMKMVNEQDALVEAMLLWATENGDKPSSAPNIVPVVTALDKLSSMIEKENKRRSSGNLTLQRLAQVMTIVGGIIEAHVRDETVLREIRDDLLKVNLSLLMGGKK